MNIALASPTHPKTRTALLALFITFTAFFLAFVDLYLVVDDHTFRSVSRAFWNLFNVNFLAFFAVVIAIMLTAVLYTIGLVRSEGSELRNKPSIPGVMAVVAVLASVVWWLFLTVHGFGLSVLAVLSTFGIVLVAAVLAVRNRTEVPRPYVIVPAVLTLLAMLTVIVLTLLSYITLQGVAPQLFGANIVELVIVLGVMSAALIVASGFVVRAL